MNEREALKLALEKLKDNQHLVADNERHVYVMEYNSIIEKCEEVLAQPEQKPVAASKKDEVFAASIEFIGTLTGMTPPPIEVAPPEVFKPFRDFTEKVCSILATPPQPEQCRKEQCRNGEYVCNCKSGECPELAQPEQEPSFWMDSLDIEHRTPTIITNEDKREGHLSDWRCIHPVYTAPPQRTWVGLTEEQKLLDNAPLHYGTSEAMAWVCGVEWAETKLKEKNT